MKRHFSLALGALLVASVINIAQAADQAASAVASQRTPVQQVGLFGRWYRQPSRGYSFRYTAPAQSTSNGYRPYSYQPGMTTAPASTAASASSYNRSNGRS